MRKGEQTKAAIVERAFGQARAVGLENVSLGPLADELGLSKSGLFAHFRSKEALQMQVLELAEMRFRDRVVRPALAQPPGTPRIVALFENYMAWIKGEAGTGGCPFLAFSHEYDDRPGPLREMLRQMLGVWLGFLAEAARRCVALGEFRADLDCEQFAFEMFALDMAYQNAARLMDRPDAEHRARAAFAALLSRSAARP